LQLKLAERGEAEAQYKLGIRRLPKPEGMRWLCRAADQGHAWARNSIGDLYEYARPPVRKDVVQAYVWHDLSAVAGLSRGAGRRDELAKKTTPAQIARAKRLVKAWKPGQCAANNHTEKRIHSDSPSVSINRYGGDPANRHALPHGCSPPKLTQSRKAEAKMLESTNLAQLRTTRTRKWEIPNKILSPHAEPNDNAIDKNPENRH